MKSIKVFLLSISISQLPTIINGQNNIYPVNKDAIILKDSLWIGQSEWKQANLYKNFHVNREEAMSVEFYSIPIYRFSKKVLDYNYGIDFNTIIIKDSTRVGGLIVNKGQIVGYMKGFQVEGKWRASPLEIFSDQSPFKIALHQIDSIKICVKDLYSVIPRMNLYYNTIDNTYIFNPEFKKFIKIADYIKLVGLKNFQDDYYFTGEIKNTKYKPIIKVGYPVGTMPDTLKDNKK